MPGKFFSASHRHARISPYKARPVIDLVRGKGVNEALTTLEYESRRAAPMIRKVIRSALANASNDMDVKLNDLVVTDARIDGGPLLGGRPRFRPRAMGRAFPIRKRTCHIVVTLSEVEGAGGKKKARRGAAKGATKEGRPQKGGAETGKKPRAAKAASSGGKE